MCDTEETIGGADLPITEERARWRHVSVCVTASFLLVGFLDLDFFVPLDDGAAAEETFQLLSLGLPLQWPLTFIKKLDSEEDTRARGTTAGSDQ